MQNKYEKYRQQIMSWQDQRQGQKLDYDVLEKLRGELCEAQIWDLWGYCTHRAFIHWGTTEYDKAIEHIQKTLKILEIHPQLISQIIVYVELSRIYIILKQYCTIQLPHQAGGEIEERRF